MHIVLESQTQIFDNKGGDRDCATFISESLYYSFTLFFVLILILFCFYYYYFFFSLSLSLNSELNSHFMPSAINIVSIRS